MNLKELQRNWNEFGRTDPLWAILTSPEKKDNKWPIDEFFKTGIQEIDIVMEHVRSIHIDNQHRKALDFGCGVGRLTQALTNHYDEVYGIDIAPSMIELANKYNKYIDKCYYILNGSNDLKLFGDDNFDFIYSKLVLQHMRSEYSKAYIKEFLRILAPNGVLVFQIPSRKVIKIKSLILHLKGYFQFHNIDQDMMSPKMEMYGVKKREIMNLIKKNRGKIIDIQEDGAAGEEWISYIYYITK